MIEVLAIIPARGGSKGVPRKNLRDLNGIPLIVYTIRAALLRTECAEGGVRPSEVLTYLR